MNEWRDTQADVKQNYRTQSFQLTQFSLKLMPTTEQTLTGQPPARDRR